jgi:aminoglycoside/choline kinase family phosphotransferase
VASADASFRRYFRISALDDAPRPSGPGDLSGPETFIIMDAPPDKEASQPFVSISAHLLQAGLNAPLVLEWHEAQGFMLLTDLGTHTMMQHLQAATRGLAHAMPDESPATSCVRHAGTAEDLALYLRAVDALVAWQLASQPGVLPAYDQALLSRELELFPQWYISAHRQQAVSPEIRASLDKLFQRIMVHNLAWPSVYVHRDFMPRNLMMPLHPQEPRLGVLDFQDAVYGPITYDVASLMRDAFWSWEEEFVLEVTVRYWEQARRAALPVGDDFGAFYEGVEWMGLQRHLKVAGIFARLTLRDGKPKYLADAPRFIHYLRSTANRYRDLKPLLHLLDQVEGTSAAQGWAFGRL